MATTITGIEMGIDVSKYLGPYVKVTTEVVKKEFDNCGDPKDCPSPKVGYCSQCGINTADRFKTRQVDDVEFDYYEELDEALCSTSWMCPPDIYEKNGKKYRDYIFLPNKKRPGEPDRDFSEVGKYSDVVIDLESIDVNGEKSWMLSAYHEEIAKLKKAYGNVFIGWGFVQWCH